MDVRLLDAGADLPTTLAKFDAERAQCFYDADRQKLLAVIEAAFGTFGLFNGHVRAIFAEAKFKDDTYGAVEQPRGEATTAIAPPVQLQAVAPV